jgi:glycosyltransferase involved in cell wall biosynthesis
MRLKILHIIPSLRKGGAERIVLDICNELNKVQNIEVHIVTFYKENEYQFLTKDIHWEVIPSKVIPSITKKAIIDTALLQEKVDFFQPDIIHTHLYESEIILSQIDNGKAKRFSHFHDNMIQLDNSLLFNVSLKNKITNFYERNIIVKTLKPSSNNFICISNDTYLYAKKTLPKKLQDNINLLSNAIDVSRFANSKTKAILAKKIRLVNIGSFVKNKNQAFLIDVVKELSNYDIELLLLGDGPLRKEMEAKVFENNLEDRIYFKGQVENVESYLWNSDIYVHSSFSEAFGLVFLEAMAAGLPVITLDGKGNRDLIEEGKNGYMIYDQDPEKFAQRIIYLIENKGKYAEISNYCKEYAKKYDIKEYVNKLLVLYKDSMSSTN